MTEDWNARAGSFDDEPDHGLRDPAVREAWWKLLGPVLPPAPAHVADIACGTGSLSLLLAEHGYRVTGLDSAPAMIERARHKAGDRVRLVLGDAADPPLGEGAYDVVLARHILFALPDPDSVLGCWSRLLAPGGRLVLIEGFWSTGVGLRAERVEEAVRRHRSEAAVTQLAAEARLWGGPVEDERFLVVSRS